MIEFYDDGGVIGVVSRGDNGEPVGDAVTQSFIDAWERNADVGQDFESYYDNWSNGYVHARRVSDNSVTASSGADDNNDDDDDDDEFVFDAVMHDGDEDERYYDDDNDDGQVDESSDLAVALELIELDTAQRLSFEYDPAQPRDPLGKWTKDGEDDALAWEVAINMSEAEWNALSDSRRAGLLVAVYMADADNLPKAAATLAKLKGWSKGGKGGGGGGGGKGSGKGGDKKSAEKKPKTADPNVARRNHADGFIAGESKDGKTRMRWDKSNKTYVIEKNDGKTWKAGKRLTPEEAYKELKQREKWYRPKKSKKSKPKAKSPVTASLTSAAQHTGAMVALVPSDKDIARLAVDGGEDPEQLHLTIAYLGEANMLPEIMQSWLINTIVEKTDGLPPVIANGFAVSMFNPGDDVKDSCVVLGVSGGQLDIMHEKLLGSIKSVFAMSGVPLHEQHSPWIPHVTLLYTDDADLSYFTDRTGPITFDAVRIAFGGNVYDIPLGDVEKVTSEADDNTADMVAATLEFDEDGTPIVPNVLIDLAEFAKERDVNQSGGSGHQLREYWVRGEGAAKIRWKTPGDFTRCVANLGKYVKDPKGLCAEYHHQATGMWPGDKRNPGMDSDVTVASGDDVGYVSTSEGEEAGVPMATISTTWEGVLTVEGIESGDSRMFAAGALTWDDPPLPLMWQKETSHGGKSDVSVRVGSIDKIWREPDPSGRAGVNFIKGSGTIDIESPDGAEVYRRMKRGYMRGNSVDVDSVKNADVELIYPETTAGPLADGDDEKAKPYVEVFSTPELTRYNKGRIRASTLVEIPAFTEARLQLASNPTTVTAEVTTEAEETPEVEAPKNSRVKEKLDAIVAATSVIEITDAPPREWFDEPTDVAPLGALTVTDEGRVYGYIAPAGVRHRSFRDRSQYVPLKNVDYGRFMGGETIVADGGRVSTGAITMNCGHASTSYGVTADSASEHYDNTCSVVATVRVGENRHGVWLAGALLPDVTPDQIRRMMACRLSGDWRAHLDRPGWREFVAALLVPVPGFPMARVSPSVSVDEGQLVASSIPVQFLTDKTTLADEPQPTTNVEKNAAERVADIRARIGRGSTASKVAKLRARISHNVQNGGSVDSQNDRVAALRARIGRGEK